MKKTNALSSRPLSHWHRPDLGGRLEAAFRWSLRPLAGGLVAALAAGCAAPPAPPPRTPTAARQPAKSVKKPESRSARRAAEAPKPSSGTPSAKHASRTAPVPKAAAPGSTPQIRAPQPAPVAASPVPSAEQTFLLPTPGAVLASFDGQRNKGVDFGGAEGDPVYAARAGQVVYSGSGLRGYGRLLLIKHDANFVSAYAHNSELVVREGQTVKRGQLVARMGSTDADRVKLHFELRRRGKAVDPMGYLAEAPSP